MCFLITKPLLKSKLIRLAAMFLLVVYPWKLWAHINNQVLPFSPWILFQAKCLTRCCKLPEILKKGGNFCQSQLFCYLETFIFGSFLLWIFNGLITVNCRWCLMTVNLKYQLCQKSTFCERDNKNLEHKFITCYGVSGWISFVDVRKLKNI